MEKTASDFDVLIIGGGLAGLCLSIQLAKKGIQVAVIEKNSYPFHRVCGEYISNESRPFLTRLGLDFEPLNLPEISQLTLTAPNGFAIHSPLKLGGFGVSRYTLDEQLFHLAKQAGVVVMQNNKVTGVENMENGHLVQTTSGNFSAKLVCGCFGKYAPSFLDNGTNQQKTNYIGVKYHLRFPHEKNRIALHNFQDGYCGMSKIENDISCLCYLTTSDNLKKSGNQIRKMEEAILFQNPHVKTIFEQAEFLFEQPLTISNISFKPRQTQQKGILQLGDAAGTIAPLCGNGMSMAMHASALLAPLVVDFFIGKISKIQLESDYKTIWNQTFSSRIQWGYRLQQLFGNRHVTQIALQTTGAFPPLLRTLISLTHGQEF